VKKVSEALEVSPEEVDEFREAMAKALGKPPEEGGSPGSTGHGS
jgi:trehalose-6-phosphate synthase